MLTERLQLRGWRDGDAGPLAELYAEDAVFHSHPFRPRQDLRDYVAWAFDDQARAPGLGDRVDAATLFG